MANNDPSSSQPAPGTDDLLPTRQSLLGRLKDWEDNRSWQEFFDTYWRLIYSVAVKAGLSASEAEEVVQETVFSVAKAMKDFQYDARRGSFKGWLLQLTGWRITNQFKKRHSEVFVASEALPNVIAPGENAGPPAAFSVAPELEKLWEAEWEQNILQTAIDRVRRQANPRHFQIFDLYVVQQKPLKEICRFLGVSAMQVYLARHRVGKLIQRQVTRIRERLV